MYDATQCMMQLNHTMHYVTYALRAFNTNSMRCYPTFSHSEMSDVLLHARYLLNNYLDMERTWVQYKKGNPED